MLGSQASSINIAQGTASRHHPGKQWSGPPGDRTGHLETLPRLDEGNRSGICKGQIQGDSGGKPLWTLFWGAGKILKTSTSDAVALPLTSLGLLSFPSWQLQRNREGTAQWQLWLSFRHSPPWPRGVRPALLPWASGLWWYNNWALFPTQLQSCLTPLETVRTTSLFLLLQLLPEASTDLTTGSVKRNPGQLSDYSRDGQLNKKVFLLVKINFSLSATFTH